MTFALPPDHVDKVLSQCGEVIRSDQLTRRQLESVVGLLNFAGPMLQLGRLSHSSHHLDEHLFFGESQGRSHSGGCVFERGFAAPHKSQDFGETDFLSSSPSIPGHFNGRLRLRLEWSDWASTGARLLDSIGVFKPHKCQRIEGHSPFNSVFPGCPVRQNNSHSYRQYGSIILFEENGFSSLSSSGQSYEGFDFILSPKENFFCSCPHPRQSQCTCRPGFTSGAPVHRVDVGSRLIRIHLPKSFTFPADRSLCHEGHCEVISLRFSLSRSRGIARGCIGSFFQLESFPISLCLSSSRPTSKSGRENSFVSGSNDPNCSSNSNSTLVNGDSPKSIKLRKSPGRGSPFSVCGPRAGLPTQGVSKTPPIHILPRSNLDSGSSVSTISPRKVNCGTQVGFPVDSSVGLFPQKAHCSTQVSSGFLNQFSAGQSPVQSFLDGLPIYNGGVTPVRLASPLNSPVPPRAPLDPFSSRIDTMLDGLVRMGFHTDIAELYTRMDKPSTIRQYQSGWRKAEKFFRDNNYRLEDINAVAFANFLGRQFLDLGLATSTVINYFYACVEPAWFMFGLDIKADAFLSKILKGMKKVRPGSRGASAFPKWPLEILLRYLNSDVFEPLEQADYSIIRIKLLILVFLNTGRRLCEIGAISGFYRRRNEVIFSWFPGFSAKMETFFGDWMSDPPKISPISRSLPDHRLCPVRAFNLYMAKRPDEPNNPYPVWYLRKSAISYLVRATIKDSFRFGSRSHAGRVDVNAYVSCHHFRKFACSYSRKYVDRTSMSLARRVGSKTFTTLNNCYIREVPRISLTFQVPLGTIKPKSKAYRKLRTD